MAINTSSQRRQKSKSKSSTSSLCALSNLAMVKLIKIKTHAGAYHYAEVYFMLNLN